MASFEELYERGCKSPISWSKVVKALAVNLVKDAQDKGSSIQAKFLAAQNRQQSMQIIK